MHLRDASQSDLIEKVIKHESGRVMVFDPLRVLQEIFDVTQTDDEAGGRRGGGKPPGAVEASALATPDERQLVSFEVHGQEYAFAIDRVKEIVTLPDEVTSVPKTPSSMLGVMVLRDEVLPLVSLRGLINIQNPEENLQTAGGRHDRESRTARRRRLGGGTRPGSGRLRGGGGRRHGPGSPAGARDPRRPRTAHPLGGRR